WISNWSNLARRTGRISNTTKKMKLGTFNCDGLTLKGKIHGFPATRTHMVTLKHGYQIIVQIDTRGKGAGQKAFKDGIKMFVKKFRLLDK
ncbi:MAG: hypothetical protein ACE5JG_05100, partial [Planctomycetota bacterium]